MSYDFEMEKIVLNNFGVAPQLHNRNIDIIFNDDEVPNAEIKGHHCEHNSVKFSLVDKGKNEAILSMDFYKIRDGNAFGSIDTYKLAFIHIYDPSLRRIGIGTFYINKLKDYMLKNDGKTMSVTAYPNNGMLKNESKPRVSKEELVEYYKSFGDENIKIEVF